MISGGLRPKVRRTERLQTGVQPPFMYSTSQSPERATDSQRHAFCHPFGVLFYPFPLRRGCTPACVVSSPSGTFCPCGYRRPERPTRSQPRATTWAFEAPSVSDNRRQQPVSISTGIKNKPASQRTSLRGRLKWTIPNTELPLVHYFEEGLVKTSDFPVLQPPHSPMLSSHTLLVE